jgi:hypothetical protein
MAYRQFRVTCRVYWDHSLLGDGRFWDAI